MSGWQCTGAQLQVLASSEPNGAGDKAESGPASSDVTLGLCRRALMRLQDLTLGMLMTVEISESSQAGRVQVHKCKRIP